MNKRNSSAYKRDVSRRKALRKLHLARQIYWHSGKDYYDNLHQFSKNKIHCSCPMCSTKTRNKGKRRYKSGNYMRHINYKVSELRRLISMDEEIMEYLGESGNGSKRKNDW